jgi:hypothetical protein
MGFNILTIVFHDEVINLALVDALAQKFSELFPHDLKHMAVISREQYEFLAIVARNIPLFPPAYPLCGQSDDDTIRVYAKYIIFKKKVRVIGLND